MFLVNLENPYLNFYLTVSAFRTPSRERHVAPIDEEKRNGRHDKSRSGKKLRTPSLPTIGSKLEYEILDRRSKSVINNGRGVIPDIVKHSPSARLKSHEDREDPVDHKYKDVPLDADSRLEDLLSPHPDDLPDPDRRGAYQTVLRSDSVADLRSVIKEKTGNAKYDPKKSSLVSLGLASLHHETMFDKVDYEDDAPGAFKDPETALAKAIEDLQSGSWQMEVSALAAVVRVATWSPDLVTAQLGNIMELVKNELRNPRSQVCKVAAQTFTKLFSICAPQMERESNFDEVVKVLLLKTGDTNKFLRVDASDALDTMTENVSIHKAATVLVNEGLQSKNVMIRVCVSFLLLHIVKSLGADRVLSSSSETLNVVLSSSADLLEDGSLDVRLDFT